MPARGALLAEGDIEKRLTHSEYEDYNPSWSPDGRWIAFSRDIKGVADVWMMAADGTKQRRVTHNAHDDLSANWSPDSTHLIFESNRTGDYNVYETTLAGTNVQRLTSTTRTTGTPAGSPASPD